VYSVLCLFYLTTCVCVCHSFHGPIHSMVHCGSVFEPRASGLPYYCTSICVRSCCTESASCVDSKPKKKKMNKKDCMMIHGTRVVLVSILLVRWSVTCCQDSCSMVRQRRIAEEYLIFFATCGRRKSGKMQLATELRLQSYGSWLISIGVRRLRAAQSPRKNAGTVASGKNVDLRRPKVPIRTRSFLETGFWLLYPSFVWFVLLSRTKRVFLISTRTRPRS